MADDHPKELAVVGAGRRGAEASLQERAGRKVGCCSGVDEEVRRIPVFAHPRSLLVGEGEVRASLEED